MRTRQKGFTLLEMVVVVAVIGILLGIAIPSYQNYVIRSNRTEGQALLSDAAARQERYYSQNPGVGYTKDVAKLGMSSANSPNNLYNLTIATPTVSERASHLAGGHPVVRQQLGQGAGLLRRQAREHVLQVGVRIVPVQAG